MTLSTPLPPVSGRSRHSDNIGRTYIAIDLKSFYASVECTDRDLDPLTTNLVVADTSRTEKTICLAVSPSLKSYGIPGRPRLFEVIQKVNEVNVRRKTNAPNRVFTSSSFDATAIERDPSLEIAYITALPRMARYMAVSAEIYDIYLKYISPDDIVVYSVDEVFIDATNYLASYKMTAHELATALIREVRYVTGITATAGIGTNIYLAKVAMDIVAKRVPADSDGVRIAELDEHRYREILWTHEPITDFWHVGRGSAKKLRDNGMFTMGDVARCSIGAPDCYHNKDLLYKLFGVNAELLIDHAWGYEPVTIADIKSYTPASRSLSSGQVLSYPYDSEKAAIIVREMADTLILKLVDKQLVTDQIELTVGYDVENIANGRYSGQTVVDHYGRKIPKHGHGTSNLEGYSNSSRTIIERMMKLYDSIVDKTLLIRRLTVCANHLIAEDEAAVERRYEQLDLFTDLSAADILKKSEKFKQEKERRLQEAALTIKEKYGKNALFKGLDLLDGATAIERNAQVGGHRA